MSLQQAYDYCFDVVRKNDKERFVAALYVPAERRRYLFALYAFYCELAKVRDIVSDPFPGEVRLQWWRDTLNGNCHGDLSASPVAAAFVDTVAACNLPVSALMDMIEARSFELYDDPMPSVADFESYACETSAMLIKLSVKILCGRCRDDVAGVAEHAGIAQTLTEVLRSFPRDAAGRQLFLPGDVLERCGVEQETIFCGKTTPELNTALAELRCLGWQHLNKTREHVTCLSADVAPAFLTICVLESYLRAMEKRGYDPFQTVVDVPLWKRHWYLWRMAKRAKRHYAKSR